jgi:cytochrome P450
MEGVLILAFVAHHWRLSLPSDAPRELPMQPAISLRPKGGVRLRVDRRPA